MKDSGEKLSTIRVKRIYDSPSPDDGIRILVDRLWPRGISKEKAAIDEWMKEIAPSSELCKWFGHKLERFEEFSARYEKELTEDPTRLNLKNKLCELAAQNTVTLLYAAKDTEHNNAVVLKHWLDQSIKKSS